jgi:hypothetical protein
MRDRVFAPHKVSSDSEVERKEKNMPPILPDLAKGRRDRSNGTLHAKFARDFGRGEIGQARAACVHRTRERGGDTNVANRYLGGRGW